MFLFEAKVVVIPGSVNSVVVPAATRYRFVEGAPVGKTTVVVILMTQALFSAPFVDWVPQ